MLIPQPDESAKVVINNLERWRAIVVRSPWFARKGEWRYPSPADRTLKIINRIRLIAVARQVWVLWKQ